MFKLCIKGILEKLDKLNESNPLRYMINGSKNKKNLIWPYFDPMAWIFSNEVKEKPLQQFLLGSFYLLEPIFSSIVWIDTLHNCVKGVCFSV